MTFFNQVWIKKIVKQLKEFIIYIQVKILSSWTEGRLRTFITSTLRGGFRKYPPKYETLKAASVGKKVNAKTNRMAEHFTCNMCKGEFPAKEVQVDHVDGVICPYTGFVDWNTYVDRLFCSDDNLQVLCTDCHDEKTRGENAIRKETKSK
jgi:hypothetical protein